MLSKVVLFCGLIVCGLAAVALGPLPEKPEKFKDVEGCYIENLDEVIPFGESKPAKNICMEYRCSSSYIHYTSCGVVAVGEGQKLVEDKEKPYPDCCPTIVPLKAT